MPARLNVVGAQRRTARILIVEDDPVLRYLYRAALSVSGYDVICASDGIEALYQLDADPPDLVVLDLTLPRLSGRDVQREISANARYRHIPILVVTGDPGDLVESDNLCILRKPVDLASLSDAVDRCLRRTKPPRRDAG
jgi:chemosensory pili system protein ChpA (sensor histidine kinase/response regulator)